MIDPKLEQLLAHLHRGGSWAYYWTAPDKKSAWHQVGRNGTIPKGANIYFGVHPTSAKRSSSQRARAIDVCAVNCLFAEFDAKDFGGSKDNTLAHIHGLALPPSVIVDSGGGYHCYWLLDEPFAIAGDDDRARIDRIQKAWVAFVGSDDGAKDLARVLRVPGTTNGKYAPPRPVVFHSANFADLYHLDDLEAISYPSPLTSLANPGDAGTLSAYAKAALNSELARVRSAKPSTRNTTLNKAAYAIGRLVGAGVLDQAAVEYELLNTALTTGLPEQEALRTIRSGMTAGVARPRHLSDSQKQSTTTHANPDHAPDTETTNPESTHSNSNHVKGKRTIHISTCTDSGNADRFTMQHRTKVLHVTGWGWMINDGKRYIRDEANAIIRLARQTTRSIYVEAANASDDDIAANLAKWAKESMSRTRLEAMIAIARSELPAKTVDFDADPYCLNCQNGTLDLRTGVLRPHDPKDLLTRIAGTDYKPGTACRLWLEFLDKVMDGDCDMISFLQRAAGYSLTGDTSEHGFMFLYGVGRNGKSTFTETLQAALGDYSGRVRSDTLLAKRDGAIPNDLASLTGTRMMIASELPEGRRLDEPLIKDLTGGDTIKVRFLRQEFFEFKPQAKVWLFGNHKPTVRGTDEGIWSRVNLIPFEIVIPKDKQDTKLPEKLRNELPGILAWMVEGCMAWQREGLKPPSKVRAATSAYRTEMDLLAQFIDECCITNSNAVTSATQLYSVYQKFAGDDVITQNEFGRRLTERGFVRGKGTGGTRIWRGIGLIDDSKGNSDRDTA